MADHNHLRRDAIAWAIIGGFLLILDHHVLHWVFIGILGYGMMMGAGLALILAYWRHWPSVADQGRTWAAMRESEMERLYRTNSIVQIAEALTGRSAGRVADEPYRIGLAQGDWRLPGRRVQSTDGDPKSGDGEDTQYSRPTRIGNPSSPRRRNHGNAQGRPGGARRPGLHGATS
jgi:hypothetical protein